MKIIRQSHVKEEERKEVIVRNTREPKNVEEGPNESESEKNSLFRLNRTNQNFLPLSMQNETPQNRHNPIPINHLFSKITSPQ
jgi:hypothetical protein